MITNDSINTGSVNYPNDINLSSGDKVNRVSTLIFAAVVGFTRASILIACVVAVMGTVAFLAMRILSKNGEQPSAENDLSEGEMISEADLTDNQAGQVQEALTNRVQMMKELVGAFREDDYLSEKIPDHISEITQKFPDLEEKNLVPWQKELCLKVDALELELVKNKMLPEDFVDTMAQTYIRLACSGGYTIADRDNTKRAQTLRRYYYQCSKEVRTPIQHLEDHVVSYTDPTYDTPVKKRSENEPILSTPQADLANQNLRKVIGVDSPQKKNGKPVDLGDGKDIADDENDEKWLEDKT